MTATDTVTRTQPAHTTAHASAPAPSRTRRTAHRLLPLVPGVVFLLLWEYSSDRLVRAA